MSSSAAIGKGTTLGYAAYPSPSSYTTIAEVFNVSLPQVDTNDVKVTHYGTSGNLHEYIAGWSEGGDVSFELNLTSAELVLLDAIRRTNKTWKITLPDLTTVVFGGYLKSLTGALPNEDKMTLSGVIKVISVPVITDPS